MDRQSQQAVFADDITSDPVARYEEIIKGNFRGSIDKYSPLELIDWDFKDFQTQYLSHKFHSYPARFIPQIPKTFISLYTCDHDLVVDPFCGCGTTIVEAFLAGRPSIGNDLNPLACLITRAKSRLIPEEELLILEKQVKKIARYVRSDHLRPEYYRKLPRRNISNLFNREMINEISLIKEGIDELRGNDRLVDLCLVALSATIWALVESENGIDVFSTFHRKLNAMVDTIREMRDIVKTPPPTRVVCGDARSLEVDSQSTSLIVTSPPYVNALDYYRVHMYNMLWLGMDYEAFRRNEIGGHSHHIANRFRLLSEYLGDMLRSMIEMNRVLKRNGVCVIAIGNSSLEYELIESWKYFVSFAERLGFAVRRTIFRRIDVTKKYTSRDIGKIDDEYIIVMEKEGESPASAMDDTFVVAVIREEMRKFAQQVSLNPGSSLRGKRVSEKRLKENALRIAEAIECIPEDIKIKK